VIAVTGATGTVGSQVVTQLIAGGAAVRSLSRTGRVLDGSVETATFSATDPATWAKAFTGITALFLIRPPQIGNVRRDLLPAVAAARASGVQQVVFLSVLGANHNALLPHRVVERWLDTSGMTATHLRAANFMQNLITVHGADIRSGRLRLPAGNAAMSYVDAYDVGAAAARCLLDPTLAGRGYDITGPAAITHAEVAATLSRALDHPVTYHPSSLPRYWSHARRGGMSVPTLAVTSALYTLARIGVGARVTEDTARILARSATSFETFARRTHDAGVW
jgi:uncharacterized protein YbjT (DUF2867 family)